MEKLLELLNAFETPKSWIVFKSYDNYDWTFYWIDCDWETEVARSDALICSKKNLFIEWLVSEWYINEWKFFTMTEEIQDAWRKIDPPEFETTVKDLETYNKIRKKYLSERLIMFLSIQDDPIKVLIEIIE